MSKLGLVVIVSLDARSVHLAAMLAARGIASKIVDERDDLVATLDSVRARGPIGLLGCGEAGLAAMVAASRRPDLVSALVVCGNPHEGAIADLEAIRAATLFIVGSADLFGVQTARANAQKLVASSHVIVVPGANAAFTQPGVIDEVADFAGQWFEEHFRRETPAKIAAAR